MADNQSFPLELKYGSGLSDEIAKVEGTIYFDTDINRDYQIAQNTGAAYIDINGVRYALVPVYDKAIKYNEDTNTITLE